MRAVTISLPWAPRVLWPNGRPPHWSVKSRAARRQRYDAATLARAAGLGRAVAGAQVQVGLTFCAPVRTSRFDLDGALASQKHAIDGVAEVLGVDDSRFGFTLARGEKGAAGKAGAAILTITLSDTAGG